MSEPPNEWHDAVDAAAVLAADDLMRTQSCPTAGSPHALTPREPVLRPARSSSSWLIAAHNARERPQAPLGAFPGGPQHGPGGLSRSDLLTTVRPRTTVTCARPGTGPLQAPARSFGALVRARRLGSAVAAMARLTGKRAEQAPSAPRTQCAPRRASGPAAAPQPKLPPPNTAPRRDALRALPGPWRGEESMAPSISSSSTSPARIRIP